MTDDKSWKPVLPLSAVLVLLVQGWLLLTMDWCQENGRKDGRRGGKEEKFT